VLTCVAVLALGIGANAAIFSVIHSVILKALPYPDAARLVFLWERLPHLTDPPERTHPGGAEKLSGVEAPEPDPRLISSLRLKHSNTLPKWNYTIAPNLAPTLIVESGC
jgi:hypothetical protein